MTGFTKDLEVLGLVCSTKGQGENVIDVPSLSDLDGYVARLAGSFPIEEKG